MEQKVAEAKAHPEKDMTLEDKINEKIKSHAEDSWVLKDIHMTDMDSCLLFFERYVDTDATQP